MPRYADVDKLMKHAISLDWSTLKWVNEVDIITYINPRVVERKKGKWIKESLVTTDYLYKCSACKKYSRVMYDYCPNCGADMREESDNG